MYAIIPDIHGDFERLEKTLVKAGFKPSGDDRWIHPKGTKAVFLGDFIDGGNENRRVIQTVRAMMKDKQAHAIMGNHELNAIMYHTPRSDGHGWLRERSSKNSKQHDSFLGEFAANADEKFSLPTDDELGDVISWFRSLPLFLEFDHFRVVHAQWDDDAVRVVNEMTAGTLLPQDEMDDLCDIKTGIGFAAERLLKGMEIPLQPNISFLDYRKHARTDMRVKWWAKGSRTYRNLALSVPNPLSLPEDAIPDAATLFTFEHCGKPVFVGHYKMQGNPSAGDDRSALCLDYPEVPCFYHWQDGDTDIRDDRIVLV